MTRPVPLRPSLARWSAVERTRRHIAAGHIVHDPDGCYTVGRYVDVAHPWGCLALLAWTDRADHGREAIDIADPDWPEPFGVGAARAFVDAVGVDRALNARVSE